MHYPLVEKIGPPELLVGRVEEFGRFHKWLDGIPRRISKSRVILARRKSSKTAFVQRLFNQLWSQNGQVIPFYLDIADEDIWYPAFAHNYFRHFASQYIAFLERDEQPVRLPLSLDEIRAYGVSKGVALLVSHVDDLRREEENGYHDLSNELCMADPFFISCVIQSEFADRDLTMTGGVINTVNFEISDRQSEMSKTWAEYLRLTFQRVNGTTTKNLMLFLNKHDDRYWTPRELKAQLNLDLTEEEIYQRLVLLAESDVILQGVSDIRFRGLQDGTLNLILRHRFEEQIEGFEPDLRSEFQATLAALEANKKSLQGRVNYLEGLLAEHLLATELRAQKHVRLSAYFHGIADDRALNLLEVQLRVPFQRADGKSEEIDLLGKAADGRVLMVEVRKRQEKTNVKAVTDLRDNALAYAEQMGMTVLPAFLSLGGFTEEAKTFCAAHGIGIADQIAYAA